MKELISFVLLAGIAYGSYSQATDTLCFTVEQIREKTAKLDSGRTAMQANKELNSQVMWLEAENATRQGIIVDFSNAIITYKEDSVQHIVQLEAKDEQIKLHKKKSNRNKFIYGASGVVIGALVGVLVGVLSK